MYACMYVCMYIYIYTCVCVSHTHIYINMCKGTHIYIMYSLTSIEVRRSRANRHPQTYGCITNEPKHDVWLKIILSVIQNICMVAEQGF